MEIQQYNARCVYMLLQLAFGGDERAIRQFCHSINIDPQQLEHPTAHLPPPVQEHIFGHLFQQTSFTDPGLQLGQQIGTTWGGLVQLITQVSPTLLHALKNYADYKHLFTDPVYYDRFGLVESGDLVGFEIKMAAINVESYPLYSRHTVEGMFVVLLSSLNDLSKRLIRPIRVEWQQEQPADIRRYEQIFGAPHYFGTASNRIYFTRRTLARPIVSHNAVLHQHFLQIIKSHLAQEPAQPITGLVRSAVLNRLNNHRPVSINEVARDLQVSTRSLQRKLEGSQTSFQQVAEKARREVALQLIQHGNHNVNEIAYLIGYDEPSSFRRAFKRWTGQSPRAFQRVGTSSVPASDSPASDRQRPTRKESPQPARS